MTAGRKLAVEALAETLCYLDRHAHTLTRPACAASRRRSEAVLALLVLNRRRSQEVGEYLLDSAVEAITRAIASAPL